MYRKLIIFFLFYLSGTVLSSAFINSDLGIDKNLLIISLVDEASQDGNDISDFLKLFPEFDDNDHPSLGSYFNQISGFCFHGVISIGKQLLQSDRIIERHLFLIYHSILLYDLV